MRRTLIGLTVLLVFGMTATAALAASAHFKKGGEPVCTFSGTTSIPVTCTGTLAGLGNDTVRADLSVSGSALYQCQNGGGNTAAGQNKVLVGPATASVSFPASAIKNGNLVFTTGTATLTAPATVSGATAGCPNANWTGVNPTLTLTYIELKIYQPYPNLIFTCTASAPLTSPVTLNGSNC